MDILEKFQERADKVEAKKRELWQRMKTTDPKTAEAIANYGRFFPIKLNHYNGNAGQYGEPMKEAPEQFLYWNEGRAAEPVKGDVKRRRM